MKIIENVPQFWYLLKAGEELLFPVSCEHSFVGYDFTMKLNAQEITTHQSHGSSYLSSLAEAIYYSAPIARGSASHTKTAMSILNTAMPLQMQSKTGGKAVVVTERLVIGADTHKAIALSSPLTPDPSFKRTCLRQAA